MVFLCVWKVASAILVSDFAILHQRELQYLTCWRKESDKK